VANDLSIVTAREALNRQFAHKLAYRDEVMETIARLAGWSEKQTEKDHLLKFNSYATYADVQRKSKSSSREQIAIVYASGTIIRGEGEHDQIGSESLCKTLNEVREDDKVKAVVLRVNSPGGDALASEIIWYSVQKLKEKKPVVVSMGNVAASGGYYISCGANYIFADAHTITGS